MALLDIEKIIYPGKSLGHIDGKAFLTDEGLPGERVEIEAVKTKPRLVEARTVRVVAPSAFRLPPRCAHYRVCSSYQIIEPGLQLEIKRDQLAEILPPESQREAGTIPFTASPRTWSYRNRARFHVLWTGAGGKAAYNVPGTRDQFVPVDICHLLAEPLPGLVEEALRSFSGPAPALREIEVRRGAAADDTLLILHWAEPPAAGAIDPLLTRFPAALRPAGIVNIVRRGKAEEEDVAWGRGFVTERIGGIEFQVGPRSFFQVNPDILPAVIAEMAGAIRDRSVRRLADVYCGLGTFGLSLAGQVEKVFAVESEPANIRLLKRNAALNHADGVTICEGPAEEWMIWVLDREVDAVIVDPPRKGLSPRLLDELTRRPVRLLLYLSCNPATLGRDMKRLSPSYRTAMIKGFDFFPQTPHIEALAVFDRKS